MGKKVFVVIDTGWDPMPPGIRYIGTSRQAAEGFVDDNELEYKEWGGYNCIMELELDKEIVFNEDGLSQ